jgi:predicted aspartyl protease
MAMLAGGEHERAESAFVATSRQAIDLNVAVASQIMLAKSLLYRRKWTTLRDLAISSSLSPADRETTLELEKWGKAFAGVDEQTAILPTKPVSLQLGITAVGTPTVRVRINGKEYDFWLDTGSSMTVLSSRVASNAHVPIVSPDTLNIGTFQGVAPVRPAIVKQLEIGPIVFGNTPAIVMDAGLMRIKSTAEGVTGGGLRVDGIIGWDIIRQLDITMDYENETITIEQPTRAGTNGTAAQNLAWVGKPLVQITTPSGGIFHFTLDTGAQATFLNAAILERMGVITETHSGRVFGFNKTGGQTERVIPSLTLGIGGISLRLERVIVYGPSLTSLVSTDGILGSDIARFGKVRIDATNGVFSIGEKD